MPEKQSRLAVAIAAYEDALLRGLCAEGAMEVAMNAVQPPLTADELKGAIESYRKSRG